MGDPEDRYLGVDITRNSIVDNIELYPGDVFCVPFWHCCNITSHMACYVGIKDNKPMAIDKWGPNKKDAMVRLRPIIEITRGVRTIIKVQYKQEDMYPPKERLDNLFKAVGNKGWLILNNCQHEIQRCVLREGRWTEGEWSLVLGFSLLSLSFTRPQSLQWWREIANQIPKSDLWWVPPFVFLVFVCCALMF